MRLDREIIIQIQRVLMKNNTHFQSIYSIRTNKFQKKEDIENDLHIRLTD